MSVDQLTQFLTRWGQATVWVAVSFFTMAFIYGVLPDPITAEYGTVMVVAWLAVVYIGGQWIWHR